MSGVHFHMSEVQFPYVRLNPYIPSLLSPMGGPMVKMNNNKEKQKKTTESDEGKKDVIKVDSSTASTASTERKGSPLTLQNLGPEVETKKKRGINPAAAALGGAALGGLAVHLINKKKNAPTERKGEPKKGGKAKAISKTPKKPVSGRRPK